MIDVHELERLVTMITANDNSHLLDEYCDTVKELPFILW